MPPIRILLVDDSPAFLESARRFLTGDPLFEIAGQALSGDEAITQVARLQPDLVLMDIAMPGMNGLEATRRLKAQPHPPAVVILTLYDNPEYRTAAQAAHADAFVAKSDFGSQLPALIHELFSGRAAARAKGQVAMKHILVADDSTTMRRMVMAVLHELKDITFGEANNGLEVIERLALGQVDLLVLDLNMPDMHGLEVLQFMRRHPAYRAIPVLILTTRGDENSRSVALAAGATRYLTKPFQPAILAAYARELLSIS
jgi:two-component system chemotaxis response regulator CheY